MSIATVVTMGYSSFGSVNLLPTIGYSIGSVVVPTVPAEICARLWVGPMLEATVDTMPMIAVKTEVEPMLDATVGDGCC